MRLLSDTLMGYGREGGLNWPQRRMHIILQYWYMHPPYKFTCSRCQRTFRTLRRKGERDCKCGGHIHWEF